MTEQANLFESAPAKLHDFDGATYEPKLDKIRLNRQLQLVFDVMKSGRWMTYHEISEAIGGFPPEPEASISARVRDFRKAKFGAYNVPRRRRSAGLFEYRLEVTT